MSPSIGRIIVASIEEMLEVTAGLVRRQVQFESHRYQGDEWIITLTGGF